MEGMDKRFPEVARDINKFLKDNVDNRGCFIEDGIFKKVGAVTWSRGESAGIGKPYAVTLMFSKEVNKLVRVHYSRKLELAYITMSQLDTTIKCDLELFTLQELYEIARTLDSELIKYEFYPTAYELWPDHPDVPFYISKPPEKSLCDIVVKREEL